MSDTQNRQPIPQRLTAIHAALDLLRGSFDAAALQARAEELEARMQAQGFWDDQQTAAKVSAEHARATRRLEGWRSLVAEIDDLDAMAELADEDPSVTVEVEDTLSVAVIYYLYALASLAEEDPSVTGEFEYRLSLA